MNQRTLSLQAQETYFRDNGRSITRIDPESMRFLGVSAGDALEVRPTSHKTNENAVTVAKCMPLYPSDDGKGIVRISEIVRKNAADVAIGDNIILKKIKTVTAKSVTLYQIEPILPVPEQYPPINGEWITDCLDTMPVIKGDTVMVPYFIGRTWFRVLDVNPAKVVTITRRTVCKLKDAK